MAVPPQLVEVSERVKQGQSPSVSVREFISWFWGSKRRGSFVVMAIRDALAEVKLDTSPDFDETHIDASITFTPASTALAVRNNGTAAGVPAQDAALMVDDIVGLLSGPERVAQVTALPG